MKWHTAPILLAFAGALGGVLDAMLSQVVMGEYGDTKEACAWIGGGIGLGIGVSLCVSRRAWLGVGFAPVLGVAGYFASLSVFGFTHGEKPPTWKDLWADDFAGYLAAVAAPVLTAAHHLYLKRFRGKLPLAAAVALYGALGALSGSAFWAKMDSGRHFWAGLLDGVVYGWTQHAGLLLALGLEAWRAEPSGRA